MTKRKPLDSKDYFEQIFARQLACLESLYKTRGGQNELRRSLSIGEYREMIREWNHQLPLENTNVDDFYPEIVTQILVRNLPIITPDEINSILLTQDEKKWNSMQEKFTIIATLKQLSDAIMSKPIDHRPMAWSEYIKEYKIDALSDFLNSKYTLEDAQAQYDLEYKRWNDKQINDFLDTLINSGDFSDFFWRTTPWRNNKDLVQSKIDEIQEGSRDKKRLDESREAMIQISNRLFSSAKTPQDVCERLRYLDIEKQNELFQKFECLLWQARQSACLKDLTTNRVYHWSKITPVLTSSYERRARKQERLSQKPYTKR